MDTPEQIKTDEAQAQLEALVREFMADEIEHAVDCLKKLIESGSGVVQDHIANGCNLVTTRNFMVAFSSEMRSAHTPLLSRQTKEWKALIENYRIMM
jgi:hypothetical protein